MRRLRGEWLLLPLFLLPLLLGGAFLHWCRGEYFGALDGLRRAPPRSDGRFASAFPPLRTDVPFEDDALGRGYARIPGADTAPWRFAADYPGGVSADVLGSEEQRLLAQTRPASLILGGPGGHFRRLIEAPDLALLREAPLPASTKLYLARRAGAAYLPWIVPMLEAVAACSGPPRPPGIHACGEAWLVMGSSPIVMTERPHWSSSEETSLVRVTCSTDDIGVRFEEPIAAWWSVEAIHGDAWWRGPELRRWGGPVAGVVLALLGLATALTVVLVRRRRADEARVRFLTEIAHDLRTPITAVRLNAEMLAAGRVPAGKEEGYLGSMARETARVSGLLANLLDLARLERGDRRFERERVQLAEAAEEAAREFRALYPDRAGDLRLVGNGEASATVDRAALSRCLANLLENAGKFTAKGVAITLAWGPGRVCIADEGPGVPVSERTRIFERYARGSAAAAAAVPGTGLGLSLVRELANGMGGSVRLVDSAKGAAFELELPDA